MVTINDTDLRGGSDLELLEYARREQRVIVTSDSDFLSLHHEGHPHSGIAFYGQRTHSIGDLVRSLVLIAEIFEPGEFEIHVEYL